MKDVFCPFCKTHLILNNEVEKSKYIKCAGCNKDFQNPFINSQSDFKSINWRNGLILFGVLVIAYYSFFNNSKKDKVYNSEYDGSVHQVERYLKNEYLKDPNSYEGIKWSKVVDMEHNDYGYRYKVMHKYRAKNSYNGYDIESKIFYLDEDGNVVDLSENDSGFLENNTTSTSDDLEYNEEIRIEAFKEAKKIIERSLLKEGSSNITFYPYNPNNVRYMGTNRFITIVKCNYVWKNYHHKEGFQIEMWYLNDNTWDFQLLKQKSIN